MHESTFLTLIVIGAELIHSDASASAVQSGESGVCTHISPLLWVSFPFRSPWSTD